VTSFKNRFGLLIKHSLKFDAKSGLFVPIDPLGVTDGVLDQTEISAIVQVIANNPGVGVDDIQKATNMSEHKLRDLLKNNPKGLWRMDTGANNKKQYLLVEANSLAEAPGSQFPAPI